MLRNLILDWSGTLADDFGPVAGTRKLIFRRFGHAELLLEEFRECSRGPFDAFYDDLLPDVALGELGPFSDEHFIAGQQTACSSRMRSSFCISARLRGAEFFW